MKLGKATISTAVLLALYGTSVLAQDTVAESDESVERITVRGAFFGQQVATAVKTPTLLVNVPQSVSVVSAQQISEQALFSIADVMQYTPGVSIGLGEDHRDQVTIRGQNTTADFFVDGLRDDVQYFRPLYNLERVEILRGANALLFGRGGGGGVVNRVTKVASTAEDFTTLSAGIDTFGAGSISVDTNKAIDANNAFRFNGVFDSIDNHRDFKDGERYALNPTYTWMANDDTTVVASYEYVNDDRLVDRGIPSLDGAPLEGYDDTYFGDPDFNNTTLEAHIARIRVDHSLSQNWNLNGTVQFADYDKAYQNLYPVNFDADAGTVTLDGYRDTTTRENTLVQLNLIGQFATGDINHTLLTGMEYGSQDTENARRDAFFADSQDDQVSFVFSDPLVIPSMTLTDPVRDRASDVTFTSAFVQDEIKLNDNWIVVAGLRYDNFDIDVVDSIEVADGADDGNNGFLSSSDSQVSPRAGLIYKPAESVSIYASYSKSFLPRSGDQFLSLSLTSQALEAEEFENKEIGVKWNLSDSLSVTAAAFEVERENGTAQDPNNPEASILTGTETKGFEVQVVGKLSERWVINAGYSNLDGEEMGRIVDGTLANRDLAQLPEHMLTLWNQYEVNDEWRVALGVIYQSEQYASLNNTVELPDFVRVDAALYYDYSEDVKIQLNVENLFDEDYFPSAHNDNNIATGEPLNARLSLQYKF
ncbi:MULTISPECIES: TonB-dependent receptor [Alteromonas]|uniref:TonB-dependent receptor n=1 Tax=Alteromonas stellipolaris TaxID=233316 RepID=A0ABM5YNG1_9ALTE|nr:MULTISPECIES: TonB-dependent siderophore receptor [Alteromonas]AMJ92437.1 TonB-dependent receptor [Alteromonas sp. Mac2]ALM92592.1 Ferrichrome-iron receptor [Alteromonas stellipolaris LMG 21856]AMJ76152.1 TonB-dependent receptor [Alteromonas stellipolaris]AMJ88582.1 TonB-dependent receptor [Alteromonas sp. Mac1]AMJ96288.1 TonB-dependent receptor [Alteromonas stellipolaris]